MMEHKIMTADRAADKPSDAFELLWDAGLKTLAQGTSDLLNRLEAVLDGEDALPGDDE